MVKPWEPCFIGADSPLPIFEIARRASSAYLERRGLNDAALRAYHEHAEKAVNDLERFRALVARHKTLFTVH